MKFKYRAGAVGILLGLVIFMSSAAVPVTASPLEDSIKQKQEQISQAQEDKKKLQAGLTNVKKVKQELESSRKSLESYIVQMDEKLNDVMGNIEDLQEQIAQKKEEIEQARKDLQKAEEVVANQYEEMKARLRHMYETGTQNEYVMLLFNAGSFADMLNQASYIEQVSAYDKQKLLEYQQSVEYMKLSKQVLEEQEALLSEQEAGLQAEQDNLNELIGQKEVEINKVQGDINDQEAAIKDYEAEIAAQDNEIKELERLVAEEKAKLAEENRIKYDGGMFQNPCPGFKRISSEYGNRMHPTLKIPKFHNGIDMAAPSGTPILAAYDGKVVSASYNSTMGNYVMIDHGDGLYTVYMHASKLHVSAGQMVSKGEHIANVGSTGRSTGPHLHFSVRLNGSYVSPWNYLK